MQFRVLGPLEVVDGAGLHIQLGGPKERAVLAMLLLEPGRSVSAEHLVDQLWGEVPPRTAANTLQTYVSRIRRALSTEQDATGADPPLLVKRSGGYALDVDPEAVDRVRFDRLAAAGHELLERGDLEGASRALRDALALWRGPALLELPDTPESAAEVARLEEQRLAVVEDRFEADLGLGRHRGLVAELEQVVAEHPRRERLRGQLALALYRSERQADALQVLDQGRRWLREELGLDPDPALQRLEAAILDHDPGLALGPPAGSTTTRAPGTGPSTPPTGPVERPREGTPLVGRAAELARLEVVLAEAETGRGRLVLVAGEPGIGKTRLVEEAIARAAPATVLWGRCLEDDAAPPFWPWVQVVRSLPAVLDDAERELALRPFAAELSRLVPEIKEAFEEVEPPPLHDPETDRFRLYDAVSRTLCEVAAGRTVTVVLDDLQWADTPSLRLLRFLANEVGRTRLVVLGTYRDTEVGTDHPLADLVGSLAADPVVERLRLRGLAPDELADLVGAAGGEGLAAGEIRHLADRTAGNPFFVQEVLRARAALGEGGALDAVPASVGDVIRRRLDALPGDPGEVLTKAAILGREFAFPVVAALSERDEDAVLDALDAAIAAGLVTEVPDRVGRFRFAHDLVREALLSPLTAIRRARLHARAARAYEHLGAGDPKRLLAELAFHWCAAGEAGDPERAVAVATEAARGALADLAFEDAADLASRALAALDLLPQDRARRCDLLLLLGDAHRRSGALAEARPVLDAALAEARILDDGDRFASIACSFSGGSLFGALSEWGKVDPVLIALLEEALDRLGPEDSARRAEVLSTLAVERYFTGDRAACDDLSAEATAIARRLGDRAGLVRALADRHVAIGGPDSVDERLALADEMVALSSALGPDVVARATLHRALDRLETGDGHGFHDDLREVATLASTAGLPLVQVQVGWIDAAQMLYTGDFTSAERLMDEAFARNAAVNVGDALMAIGGQVCQLQHLRGTVPGFADQVREAVLAQPHVEMEWSMVLALVLADEGELDELAPLWTRLRASHFDDLRRDMVWSLLLIAAAEVALTLGDHEAAEAADRQLEVLAGKVAVFGTGHMCWGAADRYRGLAAMAQGRWDDAVERLEAGISLDDRLGGRPYGALGRFRLAQALTSRARPGDADRARSLAIEAAETATELGMGRLQAKLAAFPLS